MASASYDAVVVGAGHNGLVSALYLPHAGWKTLLPERNEEMGTEEKLDETARMVEETGRRCLGVEADVRDTEQVQAVIDQAVSEFGHVDILLANACIFNLIPVDEMTDVARNDPIATNLTGVFKSIRAVLPRTAEQGYGRVVTTASVVGRSAFPQLAHYTAAKRGVIGLTKAVALESADKGTTAGAVCPTQVRHPYDPQRGGSPASHRGQGEPHRRGGRGGLAGDERPARPVGRVRGRIQRDPVSGLRRGPLHNRRCPGGVRLGRRVHRRPSPDA